MLYLQRFRAQGRQLAKRELRYKMVVRPIPISMHYVVCSKLNYFAVIMNRSF